MGKVKPNSKQLAMEPLPLSPLLITLELLECLGEPGVFVAVMLPLVPSLPSLFLSVGVGWAWSTCAAPALLFQQPDPQC